MLVQLVVVPDIIRHAGASVSCSWPVVIVSSVYVPSAFALNFPVTWRVPVTGAVIQPMPKLFRSACPEMFRHADATVQVPTTLPPQPVTLEHDAPPPVPAVLEPPPVPTEPAVLEFPPVPVPPLLVPPAPCGLSDFEPHPPEIRPNASAVTRADDCIFIEGVSFKGNVVL